MQDFDPKQDARNIKLSICRPIEIDKLINIIAYRSNSQRQLILDAYKMRYDTNLIDDLKSALNGNFQKAVIALFYTPVDYDCYQLGESIKLFGTNRDTIIEILATRSNVRITDIKRRYPEINKGKDLIKEIQNNTSGYFRDILIKLLQCGRLNNKNPEEVECKEYAQKLHSAEEMKKGMEQEIFLSIFTEKSKKEFILISQLYYKLYGKTILETIESLFKGDVKKVFKAITYALLSPSEYFAYRINKAIKGFMTNNNILMRTLISRDEIDIDRIKKYYKQLYNQDLYTTINEKIDGDYRNLLLALVGQ